MSHEHTSLDKGAIHKSKRVVDIVWKSTKDLALEGARNIKWRALRG